MVKLIIFSDGTLLQGDLALPYQLLFEPPSNILHFRSAVKHVTHAYLRDICYDLGTEYK